MKSILSNQRGNIALALVLAVIGTMSGVSLSLLAYRDSIAARLDFDGVQQLLLLRSEAERGQTIVQKLDYTGDGMYLPIKRAEVRSSNTKNTYRLKTRIVRDNVSTAGGLYFVTGYNVKSLATTSRGIGALTLWNAPQSMVRKYAEKSIRRLSIAGYHYFTDTDESMNGTPVYFWGPDEIYGRVHSNSDIWIMQGGGGSNNGWPTFYDVVTTAERIRSRSGTPPYAMVFRSGYYENVGELEYNPTAELIRAHGQLVGPGDLNPNRILFITVNGNSYTSVQGDIIDHGRDTTDVWANYPPAQAPYLFRNNFTKYDTVWTPGPSGILNNGSAYVQSKVWLKGSFSGRQTWCAMDTLYLSDNCTYTNTTVGQSPDGGLDGSGPYNTTDYLGIVSEKSIIIQYGYKDITTGDRLKPNCGSDADGIFIYAALCALGKGYGNPHQDGIFTFQYQHPHPSTVDQNVNGVLYTKIDLHRYKYPQTQSNPWPPTVDYPWYNPLWPETYGYMERGSIHLYGSVAQRRRGYVHRNLSDGDYPNPNGIWNIPLDYCGGPSYPSGTAYNAPGATGSGVGYKKDYHFDSRFSYNAPPDYPEVHIKNGLTPFVSDSWVFKRPPADL